MSKKSVARMSPGISVTVEGTYRVRLTVEGKRVSIGTFEALADAEAARVIALGEIARGVFVSPLSVEG